MEAKVGDNGLGADVEIRFGIEPKIKDSWKKIIEIDDKKVRDKFVFDLVEIMSKNKDENGFFDENTPISVRAGSEFFVDDKEVYTLFFDNLKKNMLANNNTKSNENVIANTIKQTLTDYFGGFGTNKETRSKLFTQKFDDNGNVLNNSVSMLKNTGAAECAEYASLSHNLWLLAGYKSHYLSTTNSELSTESGPHAFTIIELDENRTILFDIVQSRLSVVDKDAIKNILNNEGLTVGDNKYVVPSSAPIFE